MMTTVLPAGAALAAAPIVRHGAAWVPAWASIPVVETYYVAVGVPALEPARGMAAIAADWADVFPTTS